MSDLNEQHVDASRVDVLQNRGQRDLLCQLLRRFYDNGWISGTGGGICALESPGRLLLAPTGVHKELITPEQFFVVDVDNGAVIESPSDVSLRPSECGDIFRSVIRHRGAGAVVHSHALSAVLACDLAVEDTIAIKHLEMLKGIPGVTNADTHFVPVVGNTASEPELVGAVDDVLADERYARACAIGVRDHGAYIWGSDVWEAKKHTEVYHFLFEATVARGGLGE